MSTIQIYYSIKKYAMKGLRKLLKQFKVFTTKTKEAQPRYMRNICTRGGTCSHCERNKRRKLKSKKYQQSRIVKVKKPKWNKY